VPGRPFCGQVREADELLPVQVEKGCCIDTRDAHLVSQVIEAGRPADQVFDILDDELDKMGMSAGVAGRVGREAGFYGADGHDVGGVIERIEGRHHVDAYRGVLDGARPAAGSEDQRAGDENGERSGSAKQQGTRVSCNSLPPVVSAGPWRARLSSC